MRRIFANHAIRNYLLTLLTAGILLGYGSKAVAIELTPAERHYLNDAGTITFISQSTYPPFEFIAEGGKITGMCIELVHWMAAEFGFKARFLDADFKTAQENILSGNADVLTSFFYSEQRDRIFDFTTVMFEIPASIFVVAERTDIRSLEHLQGKTIAMQAGDYAQEFLEHQGIECRYIYTKNFAEATHLVTAGQADALVGDEQIVWYHIYTNQLTERIKKVGEPLYVGQNCMGIKDGNLILLGILNKGIAHAKEQGILNNITQKWLGLHAAQSMQWRRYLPHIVAVAALFLLILFGFWVWNIRLRHLVGVRTAALSSSENLLRTILGASPVGIDLIRNQRELGWHNRAMARMLGYGEGELEGKNVAVLYPDKQQLRAAGRSIQQTTQSGMGSPIENSWQRKDGTIFDCRFRYVPLPSDDKGDRLAIVTATDISEQKQAELALKQSERRLRAILEANPDPMVVYDHEGIPTYLNPAFSRVFGWQLYELKGRTIPFVPDDQQQITKAKIEDLLNHGQSLGFETRRYTKQGNLLEVLVSAATIKDSASEQVSEIVVNITDLTDAKRLKKRLHQAEKMEVVGTLAGGIAHDFNNILTAIIGFSELGQQKAEHGKPSLREHKQVLVAADRVRKLVKQLLTFSRQTEPKMATLNLSQEVKQAVTMVERVIPRMVSLHAELADEVKTVRGDGNQMNQILLNLCLNAADAMPNGGEIHIEVKNYHVAHAYCAACGEPFCGDYVLLQVTDSGEGMDEQTMQNLFDPFFTTKEAGKVVSIIFRFFLGSTLRLLFMCQVWIRMS
ncbi:MAG: transporter substrate-binding domain-containing protein, partial [Deltaproteobacteria bacterium]|nr:transporter substrate-binding domain-containing protein [Candidatus Anaeroferrophillus wilburensis]MBN2890071.1 transporter substrate-binding domain-containing protein [Deltaproteobacteria bacterium]